MRCQKHLFQLPDDIHYLNCAYMSPLLKSAEEAGVNGVLRKRDPSTFLPGDFFDEVEELRASFAKLILAASAEIAVIPSVSYGMANAVNNVIPRKGQHAIVISDNFPSGYMTLKSWSNRHRAPIRVIVPRKGGIQKGERWNQRILEAINRDTALVMAAHVHWMDGTRFDLKAIGSRCREMGAKLIVDGTQSVGALPIDVKKYNVDALICGAYKWLMGPYSFGLAYYSDAFDQGTPIEESWMNRTNARDFSSLTNYGMEYTPGAGRYNVGQASHLIHTPMAIEAVRQLHEWGVENIQNYCATLTQPLVEFIQSIGGQLEAPAYRAHHLIGFQLPENMDAQALLEKIRKRKIYLSLRGNSLRISPNVYNDEQDVEALIETLKEML